MEAVFSLFLESKGAFIVRVHLLVCPPICVGVQGLFRGFALLALMIVSGDASETRLRPESEPVAVTSLRQDESADEPKQESDWRDLFAEKTFRDAGGNILPYRIMAPTNFRFESSGVESTPSNKERFPLVLFLHGAGERGNDNQKQLIHGAQEFAKASRREEYPSFVVFPQCPTSERWVESDWNLQSGRGEFPEVPSGAMNLTLQLIDELVQDLPVDPKRIYVTGLSMGGMGSWYAAASKPARFAAMLEVCGGGDPSWADRYAGIPIWAFHGQADTVVPVIRGREMIQSLGGAGHWPELRYSEYPGVGHNSWTQTFERDDVYRWLFSQRKP